jgi:4-amino-4-deoxy-L-arabinose transferase-like glycosyltransferase
MIAWVRACSRPLWLLAAWVLLSAATRWLAFLVPLLDIDESAHIVGSWEVLRGGLLYTDFVNNKPPLLYAYYALAQAVAGPTLIGVRAVTTLLVVPLTALAVSAWYGQTRRGVLAAVAYLVFSAAFLAHDMLASNTEVLMMLPAAWAAVVIGTSDRARQAWRAGLAGGLVGIGVLLKYQVGTWLPAMAIAVAWDHWRRGDPLRGVGQAGWMGLGFALPLLATWAWFRAQGGDEALLYWTLGNNLQYTANPIEWAEAGERALANLVPFLLVTAPLWWGAWQVGDTDEPEYRHILVLALVVASVPPALLGLRFYPHYFIQCYVPLALAAAPWLDRQFATRPVPRAARVTLGWALVALLAFMAANAVLYLGGARVYRETDPVYGAVAYRLQADPCAPGATLFVWGYAPPFYYLSRMPAASRFVVMAQSRLTPYVSGNRASLRRAGEADPAVVPAHWDWLMGDLERRRATFVLDVAPAGLYGWNDFPISDYPRLRDYLASHFEHVDTVQRVRIFRRVGCAARRP